ncbi:MAG: DUF58 domain-containing protein [Brevibacterium yomogidense]|uniref:DUF58 domain-containing protein n=1 Tax=Brevibacterium yomogidense TaxID=946573 RepID=A0A1X6XF91_9MICO|nr:MULTISPECIES: DUF58 domain-containing protein [Brevibacterium]SLM97790.1 hypothetical protein FM105_07730 [Brevibacterium yomogidense]SMX68512.1 Uncharacterized conserved protein, DUF58 family, contains vWF domain [Brevibacterium sp. Mu109]
MRPTASGLIFLLLGAALGIAAYRFSLPGMLPAGLLLVALVILSGLVVAVASGRLAVALSSRTRHVDGSPLTTVGKEAQIDLSVQNRTPLPVGSFTLDLRMEDGFGPDRTLKLPGLSARGEDGASVTVIPTRRGISGVADVGLRIDGPFGLVTRRRRTGTRLTVAVAVPDQRLPVHAAPRTSLDQSDSDRLLRGTSTLDFHTREYVPGDDMRHVHWSSTARLGELMVRERAHEETPTAVILLDTLGADPEGHGADIAVTAAAAAALHHLDRDSEVIFWSGPTRLLLASGRGRDAVRLESARHPAGAQVPDDTNVPKSAWHVSICALSTARADALSSKLPRGQARSRFVVEELDDDGVSLDTTLFGGALNVPHQWRRDAGAVR